MVDKKKIKPANVEGYVKKGIYLALAALAIIVLRKPLAGKGKA